MDPYPRPSPKFDEYVGIWGRGREGREERGR